MPRNRGSRGKERRCGGDLSKLRLVTGALDFRQQEVEDAARGAAQAVESSPAERRREVLAID